MNNISLAQAITKNQPSWNDDPFELNGEFAGVASLSNEKKLSNFTEELVSHYAKWNSDQYELSLDMLPEFEKNELVRLYIEYTNRDTSECIYGNDFSIDNDYTCALLAMLKDDNKETRDAFAQITRKNIIAYYLNDLQKCLDDACHDCLESSMNDTGYYYGQDMHSGDMEWRKI